MSENKKGHDPILIANYFIKLKPPNLTLLKLIKLCYISHGFTLALTNKPLSSEPAGAWQYGPVFPSVYRAFRDEYRDSKEITEKLHLEDENFSDDEKKIMKIVSKKYGRISASQLSSLTHAKGTPWDITLENGRCEIDNTIITKHYQSLLDLDSESA